MYKSDSREAVGAFSIQIFYFHYNSYISIVLSNGVAVWCSWWCVVIVGESGCEPRSWVSGEGPEFPVFVQSLSKI